MKQCRKDRRTDKDRSLTIEIHDDAPQFPRPETASVELVTLAVHEFSCGSILPDARPPYATQGQKELVH